MPWKKGQSGNPGGRPKITQSVRARARMRQHDALNVLFEEMDDKDNRSRAASAVKVLQIAGVSFASDAQETKDQAEASKCSTPTHELEAVAGGPGLPLN